MEYDLTKTIQSRTDYKSYNSMVYGDMPSSMLAQKFEETNIPFEGMYDEYSRKVLTDWGPDNTLFEHERPRGGVNKGSGRLQLQYYGHRGDADVPYRAEYFDGFAGPENHDPRGINIDPNMMQLRHQADARHRFIRFSADQSEHITGGGLSEAQVNDNLRTAHDKYKNSVNIFDRQLDGARNGMRRMYEHKSIQPLQDTTNSYGEMIKNEALTPQNRVNIICNMIRNTKEWRDNTLDDNTHIPVYSAYAGKKQTKTTGRKTGETDRSHMLAESDIKVYAAAKIMSNIVANRASACVDNITVDEYKQMVFKNAFTNHDLSAILKSITNDGQFSNSITHQQSKVNHAAPKHNKFMSAQEHDIYVINSQYIHKSAEQNKDISKISNYVVTDLTDNTKTTELRHLSTEVSRKHPDTKRDNVEDDIPDNVFNYKNLHIAAKSDPLGADNTRISPLIESDIMTQSMQKYPELATHHTDASAINYSDNMCGERYLGGLGTKYMAKYIERDSPAEIFG